MASVSKVATTLTAIPVLAKDQVSLDSGIGGHLPPDWNLDLYVAFDHFPAVPAASQRHQGLWQ
jgi:hypothetical protein